MTSAKRAGRAVVLQGSALGCRRSQRRKRICVCARREIGESSMHFGLRFVHGADNITIRPIRSTTVERLIDALLEPNASKRNGSLALALEHDPALAVWAEFSLSPMQDELRSVAGAAAELAECLASKLSHLAKEVSDELIAWDDHVYRRQLALSVARYRFTLAKWSETATPEMTAKLAWYALICDVDPAFYVDNAGNLAMHPTRADSPDWLLKLNALSPDDDFIGFVEPSDNELQLDQFQLATAAELRRLGLVAKLSYESQPLQQDVQHALDEAKLTALAEFAAGAGHEMNNPLAVISGRAQLLLRGETDEARRADLALIKAQATRVHEMIADLMLFARPPAPVKQEVDLAQLVRETIERVQAIGEQRGVRINSTFSRPAEISIDPAQISAALRALLENAMNAVGDGGIVSTYVQGTTIFVRDNGPGISPEERALIFDPYFSGRQAGRGLGMGLPKCWRIIQQHGGELSVQAAQSGGTEFVIQL